MKRTSTKPAASLSTGCSFDGTFTPSLCLAFKRRRQAVCASLPQLSQVMHVNISTLRKWEEGRVTTCHGRYVARIADFLNGAYDRQLRAFNEDSGSIIRLWLELPDSMHRCIERALTIYQLCSPHPDLQEGMLDGFDGAMDGTVKTLLCRSWPSLNENIQENRPG